MANFELCEWIISTTGNFTGLQYQGKINCTQLWQLVWVNWPNNDSPGCHQEFCMKLYIHVFTISQVSHFDKLYFILVVLQRSPEFQNNYTSSFQLDSVLIKLIPLLSPTWLSLINHPLCLTKCKLLSACCFNHPKTKPNKTKWRINI